MIDYQDNECGEVGSDARDGRFPGASRDHDRERATQVQPANPFDRSMGQRQTFPAILTNKATAEVETFRVEELAVRTG
jgi:hypothetical protein